MPRFMTAFDDEVIGGNVQPNKRGLQVHPWHFQKRLPFQRLLLKLIDYRDVFYSLRSQATTPLH